MANDILIANRDLAAKLREFHELPILHEDDPEFEMGEANLHSLAEHILRYGIAAHLVRRPEFRVFSNLNLHYQPKFPSVYISPDVMAVRPLDPKREDVTAYFIGRDGPAPLFVSEVLSERTAAEGDLGEKLWIYAMIGVEEYVLVDLLGKFLPQRLLLKRLQPDRTWRDEQDADEGVTSCLGFRVIIDHDGRLRVVNAATGKPYVRPDEADQRIRALEAELNRLKGTRRAPPNQKRTGRKKKS